MKLKVFIGLSFLCCISMLNAQDVNFNIDQKLWQEDFQFLKKKIEKTVPAYQIPENKKAFDEVYEIIRDSDVGNQKEEIVYGLQRLLNTLNDEGCNVPLFQKGVALKLSPIKTYWFNDGLFVLDATESNKDIIGQQIVKINDAPVEEVFETLKPLINADNDYYKKHLFQAYGLMPSVLKLMGFGNNDNEVSLQFASGKTKQIISSSINDYAQLSRGLPNDELFSFTNTSHENENYWFEFLPNSKTLFVQLQRIVNNENGESFSDFVSQIETLIKRKKADKIILDVRYGGGGNGFKLKKFTDLLRDAKAINQNGNLFVLTSRTTRGTLLELVSILKLNTKAVIVGEPTAEGVNTVGDIRYATLPNSGIIVSLTHTLWSTSWEKDTSTFLQPDILVKYYYSDKASNQDSWLDAVRSYKVKISRVSIPDDLQEGLIGTYKIEGRKVTIEDRNGRLFLTMNRKMKSFFEIHTELYFQSDGVLATDIDGVEIKYNKNSSGVLKLQYIQWQHLNLKID
ncbi:hypothetical protein [Pontimicrobium sp. IMCC45349]|uniref:hypothetical protein n=1 Tax=Pontimicrobium sp. IMCC45349 TaxID=3391574 RepID=UPI00399F4143